MSNALTTTFHQLLGDNLPHNAGKTALIDPDRTVTYLELASEVDRLAAYLRGQGIGRGDRVIVHLRKSIAEVAAMLAVSKLGAVIVNVSSQRTAEQLAHVARDCGAARIITEARLWAACARHGMPESLERALVLGPSPATRNLDRWEDLPGAAHVPETLVLDTDLAMIIYTSGSTGWPKGVMLSHRNIVAGARSVARYLGLSHDDRLISVLTYSFDAGLNQLTTMLLLGGTVVHQPTAMPAEIVRAINRFGVTGLAGVPPVLSPVVRLLVEHPIPMPSLRRVTNTGGRLPLNVMEAMGGAFPGADIVLMYGLTESFRSTYLRPERFSAKMGSIGQSIPGAEVYVIKHGEGVAQAGEKGELVHRGPLVSMGYWGQPELTKQKIRPCPELFPLIGDEPVVYSGDIVEVDADGDLWFVGRNDEMIKSNGVRVSPDEIEDLICRSGMVADAVAYGRDDPDLGQAIHVAVSPLQHFSEQKLLDFCRRAMPSYMVPRRMTIWSEPMPRTSSGKLARHEIIQRSWRQEYGNPAS